MLKKIKDRLIGITGSASGAASIMGSWQVCHNICLGVVALLGILGITVVGMPLMFLTKLAIPFWTAAFILLSITVILYFKKRCISKNLIMLNSGLLIAGIPFQQLQTYQILFWVVGGSLALFAIINFVKDKIRRVRK